MLSIADTGPVEYAPAKTMLTGFHFSRMIGG